MDASLDTPSGRSDQFARSLDFHAGAHLHWLFGGTLTPHRVTGRSSGGEQRIGIHGNRFSWKAEARRPPSVRQAHGSRTVRTVVDHGSVAWVAVGRTVRPTKINGRAKTIENK